MHTHGSSLGPHSFHHIQVSCAMCDRCVWLFSLRRLHFPLLPHHLLSYHPVILPVNFIFQDVVDKFPVHFRRWGPWHDRFITEAYVEYTQESSSEQRFPDDFDYDDATIGKTLLDACRRRADHSEEEGLSSCLSSSVSHDRTVRPVVCSLVTSAQETQRHNSESEQIRTLLERQREHILADCQAEIRKHEFRAEYDRKSVQKLSEMIESQRGEILSCSSRGRTKSTRSSTSSWTIIGTKLGSSWSSWEKPQWNGRIEAISRLNIRHNCEEKIDRRSRYDPWTHWQDTGIAEWNQLYERFERFSRCWISTQWTFPTLPVNQCLSHLIQFLVECQAVL